MNTDQTRHAKLIEVLAKVQKRAVAEEFIYGVTQREDRSLFQRINDRLIDISRIPIAQKGYLFELLATLLHAGIPLNNALKILINKTEHPRLRRVVATLSYELEHGRSLSLALERFPEIFSEYERGVVRSAEAVGNLEQTLFKVATHLSKRGELSAKLLSALVYPIAVVGALIVGIGLMMVLVIPKLKALFYSNQMKLPFITEVLIGVSEFISNYWWLLAVLLLLCYMVFAVYTNSPEGRFSWDFQKLRFPYFGAIMRKITVMRFVDTLGLLVESGLPINQALEYTAQTVGNELYRTKTYETLGRVQAGERLSMSLADAPFLFPETVVNMIAVGEQSASLGELSQKIGAHYEREIDHTLRTLSTVLGPAMILVIGTLVALFAFAILSPVFSPTQAVS